jgi:tetratricopeptide (TPR) repeat protein
MSAKTARAVASLLAVFFVLLLSLGCSPRTPAAPAAPPPAEAFDAGLTAYEQGQFEQAAKLAASVGTPQAKVLYGQSLTRDAAQKAARAYDEALRADPTLDDAMEAMGILLADEGQASQAKTWLIKAGTTQGLSPEALVRLGDIFLTEGNCREALAAYEKAAAPQVGHAPALRRLEAVRPLCGGKAAVTPGQGKAARTGPLEGDPAAIYTGQGTKAGSGAGQKPQQKSGPKTIDLNDI